MVFLYDTCKPCCESKMYLHQGTTSCSVSPKPVLLSINAGLEFVDTFQSLNDVFSVSAIFIQQALFTPPGWQYIVDAVKNYQWKGVIVFGGEAAPCLPDITMNILLSQIGCSIRYVPDNIDCNSNSFVYGTSPSLHRLTQGISQITYWCTSQLSGGTSLASASGGETIIALDTPYNGLDILVTGDSNMWTIQSDPPGAGVAADGNKQLLINLLGL